MTLLIMTWATTFGLVFLIGSISAYKIPNIVGGSNAAIENFPYLVSIRNNRGHFCTGSIISKRHILTAAHCMWGEDKDEITIHSGTSRSDSEGHVHEVQTINIHPRYKSDTNGWYDIAVVTLVQPIEFNKSQKKVHLPTHDIENYQAAYVLGWGRMTINWEWHNNGRPLQKLLVALLPSDKCKPFIDSTIDEKQICAFRGTSKGSCAGDSGGPLVTHGVIVGIVSRGDLSNCVDGHPDINTNVYAYKDFIESAMKE